MLLILLSLAVSLSRQVRSESARGLTNDLLARLERLTDLYESKHGGISPAMPASLLPAMDIKLPALSQAESVGGATGDEAREEASLRVMAVLNNQQILTALGAGGSVYEPAYELFRDLPLGVYDPNGPSLRDAWGTPIIFLPQQHPILGMAPRNAPFFVSAGPDRKFLTRGDNLNSYEAFPRQ